jgi:hypothetical protein
MGVIVFLPDSLRTRRDQASFLSLLRDRALRRRDEGLMVDARLGGLLDDAKGDVTMGLMVLDIGL